MPLKLRTLGRFLIVLLVSGATSAGVAPATARAAEEVRTDLIVTADECPWMMAVAAPLAAQQAGDHAPPLLLAVGNPPRARADWLIQRAEVQQACAIVPADTWLLGPALSKTPHQTFNVGFDPVAGSHLIARRFWGQSPQVIVAAENDREAAIMGGWLAAHRKLPLLLRPRTETAAALLADLADLAVTKVLGVVTDDGPHPRWAEGDDARVEILDARGIQQRVTKELAAGDVRTIVVARAPDETLAVGRTAWLAPYVCLVRRAPLLLVHSADAEAAERQVDEFIRRHQIRPQTVTLLADEASIGTVMVELEVPLPPPTAPPDDDPPPDETAAPAAAPPPPAAATTIKYQVRREPCVRPEPPAALPLGVGRIPLESLGDATVLFARGLLRQRQMQHQPPRIVMVSNVARERTPLPLCEVISQVTAREIRNFGVELQDFYGMPADSPPIIAAARQSSLMIFQGHLTDQDLVYVPWASRHVPDDDFEEALQALAKPPEPPAAAAPRHPPLPPLPVIAQKPHRLEAGLEHFPVLVLQACQSLNERLLDQIDELGFVAALGSVTSIHSGSGSTTAHMLVDSLLYNGATLGEALRDAQNYLLCLEQIKIRSGSKDHPKGRRVLLSFRLWGDPELPGLALGSPGRPKLEPVTAGWTPGGDLEVRTPKTAYPETANEQYRAKFFPGATSSGMIGVTSDNRPRRVRTAYYVQVPLPAGFAPGDRELTPLAEAAGRAAYLVDPLGRFLKVVYVPDKDRASATATLRFAP